MREPTTTLSSRLNAVYTELLGRAPESRMQPRLGPMRVLCEILGEPQQAYPVIQITGTNGKTSVARMIERLLREHNLRTGRYTSPHLHRVTERISVDGTPVSDDAFADTWDEIATMVAMVDGRLANEGSAPMTFFEVLTAMAYAIFADAPVDVAVVEVGLGGTWDATNVADAAVSVVTPISLDHVDWLGHTIEQIATEKAGIFAPDSQVTLAEQPLEALTVLGNRARELNCTLAREGLDFGLIERRLAIGGQTLDIKGLAATYTEAFLPLHGVHQAHNAAVAVAAVETFLGGGRRPLNGEVLSIAMQDMSAPGRLELVRAAPTVFVDAAHNPSGIAALTEAIQEITDFERLIGVVGILADKPAEIMLGELEPLLSEVVITASSSPRAIPPEELADIARDVFGADRVHEAARLDDALQAAVDLAESGAEHGYGILVTGSVTIVAEARLLLRAGPVDPPDDSSRAVELGDDPSSMGDS